MLLEIEDPNEHMHGSKGCGYCGGLGHSIASCPKRQDVERKQLADQRAMRDYVCSFPARYNMTVLLTCGVSCRTKVASRRYLYIMQHATHYFSGAANECGAASDLTWASWGSSSSSSSCASSSFALFLRWCLRFLALFFAATALPFWSRWEVPGFRAMSICALRKAK